MDIRDRIKRRQRSDDERHLVTDYVAISPVAHPEEPVDRGSTLEALLDVLEPAFDGSLPPSSYLWGPKGSGKTALLRPTVRALDEELTGSPIYTTTRAGRHGTDVVPVYLDARTVGSEFELYHALLDALLDESVPSGGVGTADLREKLETALGRRGAELLAAVDHLGEPETMPVATLEAHLAAVDQPVSFLAAGRTPPGELGDVEAALQTVAVDPYEPTTLADVLTTAATRGLAARGLEREETATIAEWADGDAHDALGALFLAADRAAREGRAVVDESNVADAIAATGSYDVAMGRLLALPENRKQVLEELVATKAYPETPIDDLAAVIAGRSSVDISSGTVRRYIYELCNAGILERVETDAVEQTTGRPASAVETRFSAELYSRLRTIEEGGR